MVRVLAALMCWAGVVAARSVEEVVSELVDAMNATEKYGLMAGMSSSSDFSKGYYVGTTVAVKRLGIPALKMQDNGNGFRTTDERMVGQVTSWSCALGLASTWDGDLASRFGEAVGDEFKKKGANVVLGPGLNVHRVARGGRNAEYLSGEDPVLGARLAKPWIEGFQKKGVLATAKHFAFNNQETNRQEYSAEVSERAAREVYWRPFFSAIHAAAFMCSYNSINGTHACSSAALLAGALKSDMGFQGFVMSDWGATHGTTVAEGLDVDMPGSDGYFSSHNLSELDLDSVVDASVTRILTPMVEFGLINTTTCDPGIDCEHALYQVNATSNEHWALSNDIATASVLLLKNKDRTLPVTNAYSVGVVGSACNATNDVDALFDSWNLGNYYVIGGSGRVVPESVVSVLEGVQTYAEAANVSIVKHALSDSVEDALTLDCDVLIACAGGTTSEGDDRASLSLDQEDFLVRLAAESTTPVVAVLLAPGPVLTPFAENASAVVALFLAGAATGTALGRVLFGQVSPSAKLPVTFPTAESQTVPPCDALVCVYDEDLYVGYRALSHSPVAFPFGHGLSYSNFDFKWLDLPPDLTLDPDGRLFLGNKSDRRRRKMESPPLVTAWHAAVTVTNIGDTYTAAEVPQLYLTFPDQALEPPSILKSFAKTPPLPPGHSAVVALDVYLDDLQVFLDRAWTFVPGDYHFQVGASSRDIRLNHTASISSSSSSSDATLALSSSNQASSRLED